MRQKASSPALKRAGAVMGAVARARRDQGERRSPKSHAQTRLNGNDRELKECRRF
jgi:hypothetical protein